MRFMFIVTSADMSPPSPELMDAIGKLSEEEIKAGRMVDSGGLLSLPMAGARVQLKGGQLKTIDSPYAEAKEFIGGYAVFDLKNMEEAVASAQGFMQLAQGPDAGLGRYLRGARHGRELCRHPLEELQRSAVAWRRSADPTSRRPRRTRRPPPTPIVPAPTAPSSRCGASSNRA